MKITNENSCLLQPINRNYKSGDDKREEHFEVKNDGISHALRCQGQLYVAIEVQNE